MIDLAAKLSELSREAAIRGSLWVETSGLYKTHECVDGFQLRSLATDARADGGSPHDYIELCCGFIAPHSCVHLYFPHTTCLRTYTHLHTYIVTCLHTYVHSAHYALYACMSELLHAFIHVCAHASCMCVPACLRACVPA